MASEASQRFNEVLGSLGRPVLGALFPGEFEVYMMTLELIDSEGEIADYLSFPVLPDDVTKTEPELTNIKKSAGGVTSLTTSSFTPQDITINGNFGRAFKVLIGREMINFKAFGASLRAIETLNPNNVQNPFDIKIKTGFGCTKILQAIVSKSNKLDLHNKPYKLFFHNPTLGESYLVEKMNLTLRMDKNTSNRIWGYSLVFKILAPANSLIGSGASSLLKTIGIGALQKSINILADGIGTILLAGASSILTSNPKTFPEELDLTGNNITQGGGHP
jgi:hypothetical protein